VFIGLIGRDENMTVFIYMECAIFMNMHSATHIQNIFCTFLL